MMAALDPHDAAVRTAPVVALSGEVDIATAPGLELALEAAAAVGSKVVVVDLSPGSRSSTCLD
jgi:anti-anti-sigma regulatory factor